MKIISDLKIKQSNEIYEIQKFLKKISLMKNNNSHNIELSKRIEAFQYIFNSILSQEPINLQKIKDYYLRYSKYFNYSLEELSELILDLDTLENSDKNYSNSEKLEQSIELILSRMKYEKLPKTKKPTLNIVISQAGGGKSFISQKREYKDKGYAILDTDLYRDFHPFNETLAQMSKEELKLYDQRDFSAITHEFSSDIRNKLRDEIFLNGDKKPNVVLETTNVSKKLLKEIIPKYRVAGYEINLEIMATTPEISSFSIYSRFLFLQENNRIGRSVPISLHNESIDNINNFINNVEEFKDLFDKFSIFSREEGEVFNSKKQDLSKVSKIFQDAIESPLSQNTIEYLKQSLLELEENIKINIIQKDLFEEIQVSVLNLCEKYKLPIPSIFKLKENNDIIKEKNKHKGIKK